MRAEGENSTVRVNVERILTQHPLDGCLITLLEVSRLSVNAPEMRAPSFLLPQKEHKHSRGITRTRPGIDSAAFKVQLLPVPRFLPSKHVESRGDFSDHPSREATPPGVTIQHLRHATFRRKSVAHHRTRAVGLSGMTFTPLPFITTNTHTH